MVGVHQLQEMGIAQTYANTAHRSALSGWRAYSHVALVGRLHLGNDTTGDLFAGPDRRVHPLLRIVVLRSLAGTAVFAVERAAIVLAGLGNAGTFLPSLRRIRHRHGRVRGQQGTGRQQTGESVLGAFR